MIEKKALIIKRIEMNFKNIDLIKRACFNALSDINQSDKTGGSGGVAYISDPTANQAIRTVEPKKLKSVVITYTDNKRKTNIVEIHQPQKWVELFEQVYKSICKDFFLRTVFTDRYIRGWRHRHTIAGLNISKKTYFNLRNEIVTIALAGACQLNLVKILKEEES